MAFKLFLVVIITCCLCVPAIAQEKTAPATIKPREVRKVRADGKHNAFTALARFKGEIWLAFRAGKDHNSRDGDIVIMRSADGKEWTENHRLDACTDDRDPQFLVVGDRLVLYDACEHPKGLTCYAIYTDDGKTWSKPQAVYEPHFLIWKPIAFGGKYYSGAHKIDNTNGGKNRDVHLVVSEDGLQWKKISRIRAGSWESETTLHFDPQGNITAFLRQKYGSPPAQILEAAPPYTEWKSRVPDVNHFSGHSVHTFKGVDYFMSRTVNYGTKVFGCTIFIFANGKLQPYCVLPASGDCSYTGAVLDGDDMLVSYYSSHEGTTNVYVAVVPLKK